MSSQGLMLSAYKNADGTMAVVAINYSGDDRKVALSMPKDMRKKTKAEVYRTPDAEGENLKHVGEMKLDRVVLPARSVTTLLVK